MKTRKLAWAVCPIQQGDNVESKPSEVWARHLHWNARPDFKQAVRFLFKVGHSAFKPKRLWASAEPHASAIRKSLHEL